MAKVTIYGASDDLIEVEGYISEEFSPPSFDDAKKGTYLAFSDGSVWKIKYSDGCWRITPVMKGTASVSKVEAVSDDSDDYSDRVTLDGDIRWVVHGTDFAKP